MGDLEITIEEDAGGGARGTATNLLGEEVDPALLPEFSEGNEIGDAIKTYIFAEVNALLEGETRAEFLSELSQIRKEREGIPDKETKTEPWQGAANLRVPLAMTNTQEVYAMIKGNFVKRAPLWSVTAKAEAFKAQARGLEALVSFVTESKDHANVRVANNTIFYTAGSEGLAIVKVPWVKETHYYKTNDTQELIPVVRRDSPFFKSIPNEYALIRPEWEDVQRAPWIGTIDVYYEHELKAKVAEGYFDVDAVEKVLSGGSDSLSPLDVEGLEKQGRSPSDEASSKRFLIVEVFLFWDIDGTGQPIDLVLTLHPSSTSVLRAEYNDLRYRPVFDLGFGIRPHSLQQLGVGQMLHGMQAESDFQHNLRIDAAHMMLSPPVVVDHGVDLGEAEQIRPGKVLRASGPEAAMKWLQIQMDLGSSLAGENLTNAYAERTTGMTAAQVGVDSQIAKSGATLGGIQFNAAQGGKIFSAHLEVIKDKFSEGGKILAFQILTHKEVAETWLDQLPDDVRGDAQTALSSINPEDLPSRFTFSVKTTEMEKTEEAKKQALMSAIQLYTIYGQQAVQLAAQIYSPQSQLPPQVKDILSRLLLGQTSLMKQAFEGFNQDDNKDFLAYVKDIEMMVEMTEQARTQQIGGMSGQGQGQTGFDGGGAGGGMEGGSPNNGQFSGAEQGSGMEAGGGVAQGQPQGGAGQIG